MIQKLKFNLQNWKASKEFQRNYIAKDNASKASGLREKDQQKRLKNDWSMSQKVKPGEDVLKIKWKKKNLWVNDELR